MTARPVGGDTREALREEIARSFAPKHWPILLERHRDRLRAHADAVLALPTVRAALAAQETVRRVEALADELAVNAAEAHAAVRAMYLAERPAAAEAHAYKSNAYDSAADRIRRALDGES